jgi:SAM-dependent methyltransferase
MNPSVIAYYDRLAQSYDTDRFGTSYGHFVDAQERRILHRFLPKACARVLDVGCGTGRLTDRASFGCDASIPSLVLAAERRGNAAFAAADAAQLPFQEAAFDGALAFHVFMHLEREEIRSVFAEVARVLKPGGVFVADVASALRRRFGAKTNRGWHGATALSASEFAACGVAAGLRLDALAGVMLLPIHRLPHFLRRSLVSADLAAASLVPECASYLVGRFVKERAP